MKYYPTTLLKTFAWTVVLCTFFSNPALGQQTTDYQIIQRTSQPAAMSVYDAAQPVTACLSDCPKAVQCCDCPTEKGCGCRKAVQCSDCPTGKGCGCRKCGLKSCDDGKPNPCAGSHKGLFYANDFSYLLDEDYDGYCLGDCLKRKKVGRCGNLDIGGQIRFRYHSEIGMGQEAGLTRFEDTDNDFLLSRFRLYGDWKVNNKLRFFAEGIYAGVTANDEYVPRPIDRNHGDFLNLFADVSLTDSTIVRIGRQELLYGAQRTISPLDWANTRRTFTGVRTISKFDDLQVDAFWTRPVLIEPGEFDSAIDEINFYGTYMTYTGMENKTLDLYAVALSNNGGAVGIENFVTYGARLQGSTKNKLLYESEAAIQSGFRDVTNQDLLAQAWMGGLGYQFQCMPWKPTLWGFYDFASGDAPGGDFRRYNQLFPLAHKYLGFIDAVARTNIKSPNFRLTMSPRKKLSLLFWYYNFQADEAQDVITSIGGTPAQDPTRSNFGNELDILAKYQCGPRSYLIGGYSHLWRGAKILGDTDADFFYLDWTTNF